METSAAGDRGHGDNVRQMEMDYSGPPQNAKGLELCTREALGSRG